MGEEKILGPEVEDIDIEEGMTAAELMEAYRRGGGFLAGKLAQAAEITGDIVGNEKMTRFLSFPACIIATGTRGVIRHMVRHRMIDVIITTAGTVDHDLARLWKAYHHGRFEMDDAALHREGINRLGNILVPNESYGTVLEERLQPMFQDIYDKKPGLTGAELLREIGARLEGVEGCEKSIIYWAYKNEIPIFIPGIMDGALGAQIWLFWQTHKDFSIDIIRDEHQLSDIVYGADSTGAIIIGGGISKHHTIWWNQFIGGLDLAVYITTAVEYDGSLSGARMREAVSWGKLREKAKYITVEGDATVLLPLIMAAIQQD